ncbi:MAG TPA: hypothetical protein VNA69_10595 [Thermoanaerobaculia bacterium]|nr:hypothetical protein [Thermoanaerobaculia bacterium]
MTSGATCVEVQPGSLALRRLAAATTTTTTAAAAASAAKAPALLWTARVLARRRAGLRPALCRLGSGRPAGSRRHGGRDGRGTFSAPAASAAAPSAASRIRSRLLRGTLLLLLLLRRALLLLLLLRTLWPLRSSAAPAALLARRAFFFARRSFPGALLELAHFFVHEAPRLRLLFPAQLVMAAVGAALPTFGIRFPARAAEDAFWKRHRKSARIVHFGVAEGRRPGAQNIVDKDRRHTLQTLLDLAGESSPNACWDDSRAIALLRSQATEDELRELGASESLIAHIFAEQHAG